MRPRFRASGSIGAASQATPAASRLRGSYGDGAGTWPRLRVWNAAVLAAHLLRAVGHSSLWRPLVSHSGGLLLCAKQIPPTSLTDRPALDTIRNGLSIYLQPVEMFLGAVRLRPSYLPESS